MNFLRRLALQAEELDDSSRLDVVEIARVALCASEFVSFPVGLRTYQHTVVFMCMYIYTEIKQSHYPPGEALRFPGD